VPIRPRAARIIDPDQSNPDHDLMEVAASTGRPASPTPSRHRWGPLRWAIVALCALLLGLGASAWWASGCHDDFCTGSTHRVTITVRAPTGPPNCWNNIDDAKLAGRYWESHDHAPAAWGTGPVTGTFLVTGDGQHRLVQEGSGGSGWRTAVFTADRGGSVDFFGGTAGFLDDLMCGIR
jgi:hypothetical protein